MTDISAIIQNRISSIGNTDKAKWLENYVKHDIKSKGVGIPEIREIVKQVTVEYSLLKQELDEQMNFLNHLMRSEYTEDKLTAIIFMQIYLDKIYEHEKISKISEWFDKELIKDWNVCDWLCVRFLSQILNYKPTIAINTFSVWIESNNLWKARASLVPFAQCNNFSQHKEIIYQFSAALIKRNERFCKTAVGWVLREYSKTDKKFVSEFLEEYKGYTTKEVIKNATKYIQII